MYFCKVVYFGRCVPWIIIDAIPYFKRWKLQPDKVPTPAEQWECTKQVLFSHFTIELPAVSLACTLDPSLSLKRVRADLVVPSHGRNVWHANPPSTFPILEDHAPTSCLVLRV